MRLSDAGESRVTGYLFVLKKSLRSFLPADMVAEAVRELESHIRERIRQSEPEPDEKTALEGVLAELGKPTRVAQAYSGELVIEEAVITGRVATIVRAMWHLATTTFVGFLAGIGLLIGYSTGLSFLLICVLKPVFPENVGIVMVNGIPRSFGYFDNLPAGTTAYTGYWIIPICIVLGLVILVVSHRAAKRFLGWWRGRQAGVA